MKIAVMPGDGVDKEVIPEGIKVLGAAAKMFGFTYSTDHYPFGGEYYIQKKITLPDSSVFLVLFLVVVSAIPNVSHKRLAEIDQFDVGRERFMNVLRRRRRRQFHDLRGFHDVISFSSILSPFRGASPPATATHRLTAIKSSVPTVAITNTVSPVHRAALTG